LRVQPSWSHPNSRLVLPLRNSRSGTFGQPAASVDVAPHSGSRGPHGKLAGGSPLPVPLVLVESRSCGWTEEALEECQPNINLFGEEPDGHTQTHDMLIPPDLPPAQETSDPPAATPITRPGSTPLPALPPRGARLRHQRPRPDVQRWALHHRQSSSNLCQCSFKRGTHHTEASPAVDRQYSSCRLQADRGYVTARPRSHVFCRPDGG
jgi:hypothetical protein